MSDGMYLSGTWKNSVNLTFLSDSNHVKSLHINFHIGGMREIKFRVAMRSKQDDVAGALLTAKLSAHNVLLELDSSCAWGLWASLKFVN